LEFLCNLFQHRVELDEIVARHLRELPPFLDVELFELNVHNGLSTETPVVKYLVAQVFGECPLNQSNPLGKDGRDTHLLAQAELNSPLGSYLEVLQCELFKPTP
jgi:hypothetical protein